MKKIDLKRLLPYIAAIVVFYLVSIAYFSPVFFENKRTNGGDGISYMGWGNDAREHFKATGEYSFWSNAMFGGMPSNYSYPTETNNVFDYLEHAAFGFLEKDSAGPFFAYMLGFFVLMIAMGCSAWLSAIGAIAYALCSYNLIIIEAGHISKAYVMATIAPVIGGIILCYRKRFVPGVIITLLAAGLNVFWNHQQISYYLLLTVILLAVVYFVYALKENSLRDYFKSSAVLVVVALLAVSPAVDKLIPNYDYAKETMRGGAVLKNNPTGEKESGGLDIDYAYQWSYGKAETMTLLIPNFYGASSNYNIGKESALYDALRPTGQASQIVRQAPMYWGDQPFTSGPVYVGAIICFLFLFGMIVCRGPERWWVLAAIVLTTILSWGRNFPAVNEWLFHNLPMYNKFRTPSMALVIPSVLMVMIGILGVREVVNAENKRQYLKPLYISAGITAGLSLFFALFGGSFLDFSSDGDARLPEWLWPALVADRKAMLVSDAWRSFLFIVLAASAMFFYLNGWLKQSNALYAIVGVLVIIDLWVVDKRFLNNDNFVSKKKQFLIEATAIDKQILRDTDPDYRVLNLATNTFNESYTSYYHKSVGGYSPVKLRRYQDIIDFHISQNGITPNVIDMLNTRYYITQTEQGPQLVRNVGAMGNAWFVDHIQWTESPDEEINALYNADIRNVALIERMWADKLNDADALEGRDSTAHIELAEYDGPGHLVYNSYSGKSQLAVFSEIYYKTWRLYIDGVEAPIVRANYILRAAEIPAGKHRLEFRCVDELYLATHRWSLVASVLVVLVVLCAAGYGVMKARKGAGN